MQRYLWHLLLKFPNNFKRCRRPEWNALLGRSIVPRTFKGPWHPPAACDRAPQLEETNAVLLLGSLFSPTTNVRRSVTKVHRLQYSCPFYLVSEFKSFIASAGDSLCRLRCWGARWKKQPGGRKYEIKTNVVRDVTPRWLVKNRRLEEP